MKNILYFTLRCEKSGFGVRSWSADDGTNRYWFNTINTL